MNKTTLSYSSLELFHSCERKYQHRKELHSEVEREESPALSNGRAVDEGYGEYLITRDLDRAIFKTWLGYWPVLEDNIRSEAKAIHAVRELAKITPEDWTIWTLPNGRPATQVAIKIDCSAQFNYVGFVDAIVQDAEGTLIPIEVKTTSIDKHPSILYANSAQALAYAFCIYAAQGKLPTFLSYVYMIARMPRAKSQLPVALEPYWVQKSVQDVLQWLITLKLDIQRIEQLRELNFFPKRNSCYNFGKECPYFSICDLTDAPTHESVEEQNDLRFDFEFALDKLIDLAMQGVGVLNETE